MNMSVVGSGYLGLITGVRSAGFENNLTIMYIREGEIE